MVFVRLLIITLPLLANAANVGFATNLDTTQSQFTCMFALANYIVVPLYRRGQFSANATELITAADQLVSIRSKVSSN